VDLNETEEVLVSVIMIAQAESDSWSKLLSSRTVQSSSPQWLLEES